MLSLPFSLNIFCSTLSLPTTHYLLYYTDSYQLKVHYIFTILFSIKQLQHIYFKKSEKTVQQDYDLFCQMTSIYFMVEAAFSPFSPNNYEFTIYTKKIELQIKIIHTFFIAEVIRVFPH